MKRSWLPTLAALLWLSPLHAHTVGISRGEYRATESGLAAELTFARPEIRATVPELDGNRDGVLDAAEVAAARPALDSFVAGGVSVRSGKKDCGVRLTGARLTEQDGLALSLQADCSAAAARYDVELRFLRMVSVGHRHLATWHGAATDRSLVAYEASPAFALERSSGDARNTGPLGGVAWPLFRLGVEHILTGYDHLLFLFGLILVGGTLRELLVVVTAFTLAHSITLALAALGVVAPSPAIVEPAIALSIAYVGVENWFVKDAARRWLLTFPFGLIHGFGFAAALQEISLPKADIPLALVSFNLGVEAGQVAVLALVLPLLLRLRRRAWFVPVGVRVLSSGIACAGLVWFVLRVS